MDPTFLGDSGGRVSVKMGHKIIKLILPNDQAVEEYHSPTITNKLKNAGFIIQKSKQYLANCSIICRRVEKYILDQPEKDLEEAITQFNDINITNVTTIKQYNMLKITCCTPKRPTN